MVKHYKGHGHERRPEMSTMGSGSIVRTEFLSGGLRLAVRSRCTDNRRWGQLRRPRLAGRYLWRVRPRGSKRWRSNTWNATPSIITSEYEYHEPTNQSKNQQYGGQVALSGDGGTLAVADVWYFGGSEWPWYGSGAVYVYRRVSNSWQLEVKLEPPAARGYDFFGSDVALSMAGNVLVVGAQYEGYDAPSQDAGPGSVFVYKRRNGAWTQETMLRASRAQDSVIVWTDRRSQLGRRCDRRGGAVRISGFGRRGAVRPPVRCMYSRSKRARGPSSKR